MKIHVKRLMTATIIAIVFPLLVVAQNSNVAGTWKMNPEKSKFEDGGPAGVTIKFEPQEDGLKEWLTVKNERGERTMELSYKTDGTTNVVQVDGRELKVMAKWEGNNLTVALTETSGSSFTRKFAVSQDGKTINMSVRRQSDGAEKIDSVLLEKQ
jgi:hypothetical protein